MGITSATPYKVSANYVLPNALESEAIAQIIEEKNPMLKLLNENISLFENQLMLNKASLYPQISSFANYGFLWQRNDLQQLAQLQNVGFMAGISLRYHLFDGKRVKKNIGDAKLRKDLNEMKFIQTKDELLNKAMIEVSSQKNLKIRLAREEQNLKTFEENYTRTEERYLAGKANSLEVREAQLRLLTAKLHLNQLQIDLLKSSLRLESIKGTLVGN